MGLFLGETFSGAWKGGKLRFDIVKLSAASSISSLLLDVFVLCFPLLKISKLHLRKRKKVGIAMIFWLGAL